MFEEDEEIDPNLDPTLDPGESKDDAFEKDAVAVSDFLPDASTLTLTSAAENTLEHSHFSYAGHLGIFHFQAKDYGNAIPYLEKAVAENSTFDKPYAYLGYSYLAIDEYKRAISTLTLAFLNSNQGEHTLEALYYRAVASIHVHEYDAAIRDFSKVVTLSLSSHPLKSAAIHSLNSAYNRIGNFSKVIRDTTEALGRNGHDVLHFEQRGWAYLRLGQYDAAIQDYNNANNITPLAVYYANLAIAKFHQGNIEAAIQDLDRALVLEPKVINNLLFRALCHIRLHHFNLAENDLLAISALPLVDSDFTLRFIANFTLRELERAGRLSQTLSDEEIFERDSTIEHVQVTPNKTEVEYYASALIAEESGDEEKIERAVYDLFNNQLYPADVHALIYGGFERFIGKSKEIQEAEQLVAQYFGVKRDDLIAKLKQKSSRVLSYAYLLVVKKEPFDQSFCVALWCAGAKNKIADLILARKTPEKFFDLVRAVRNGDLKNR